MLKFLGGKKSTLYIHNMNYADKQITLIITTMYEKQMQWKRVLGHDKNNLYVHMQDFFPFL